MTENEKPVKDGSRELPILPDTETDVRVTRGQDMSIVVNKSESNEKKK